MNCKANNKNNSTECGSKIITNKEAKKLLGSEYADAPDEFVEQMVSDMTMLSSNLIEWQNGSTKAKGVL